VNAAALAISGSTRVEDAVAPARPYAGALLTDLTGVGRHTARPAYRPPPPDRSHFAATLGGSAIAYDAPAGRPLARLSSRTEYGSPRVMPVLARRGRWLRVVAAVAGRNAGWVLRSPGMTLRRLRFELVADRSSRTLTVLDHGRVAKRIDVAVGRPDSPTPLGRLAVTDRLSGAPYAGAYGCCVLALSGHQARLPSGWTGGDRLAIHSTDRPDPTSGGSAGCLVASDAGLRYLMRRVRVGTLVTIRR
jgi:hypothetical protein